MSASLTLFASAVAGRAVPVETTSRAVGRSDGLTIMLPAELDPASAEARRLVICLAAPQRIGSYQRRILRRLDRAGSTAAARYHLLEVWRACHVLEGMLPRSFVAAVAAVVGDVATPRSAEDSARRARSTEPLPVVPAWFGELVPSLVLSAGHATAGDQQSPSDAEVALAAQLTDGADDEEDDGQDGGGRIRILEALSAPVQNSFGDAVKRLLGRRSSSGEGSIGGEMPISGARRSTGSSAQGRLVPGAGQPRVEMAGHLVVGAAYPEWDTYTGHYRDDWALVGEFDPPLDESLEPSASTGDRVLMRRLAQLGLSWQTHRGEPTGDGLDLSALVDLRARIAAGEGGTADIYTAHRRTSQRLGVLILLDATGSTAEHSEGAEVFAEQRTLALDLTTALDELGVRVGTYAFHSRGRRNVRFLHAKSFDEPWSAAARRRLMSVSPSGFTRLGAAIRHATHVVATRAGTDHQLLIVIGDGVVYDDGYEGAYGSEDSRFAIEEAAAKGVALVGLSVRPFPDESIWPPEQHGVARDAGELAPQVRALFGGALQRSRSAQRPASGRDTRVGAGV